jgi:glycosyltransferase involved in cell wall biosynthesis
MSVSIICACKNRNAPLKISLSSWLSFSQISEIIIVDWSSDESLNDLANLDPRIKIISVPNQKYFNQPEPLNLAASLATGDYILKVDADYILNPYYNFFDFYKVDNTCFVCGENGYTQLDIIESPYFRYLRGLLYVTRENFLKIGGFNENITKYYAYEDDEIDDRLELLGLEKKKVYYNHNIIHIPHPDKKRLENFEAYHTDTELTSYVYSSLSTQFSGDELQWQAEYVLAQEHIQKNKQQCLSEDNNYYFQSKIKWHVTQISNQLYTAEKS